ncbi:hypothetical protein C8F01DRAFT_1295454 [Mycena amicta]|nr:hypothetical protein C8F01DRAFT_1295454 [Mycena amicta]
MEWSCTRSSQCVHPSGNSKCDRCATDKAACEYPNVPAGPPKFFRKVVGRYASQSTGKFALKVPRTADTSTNQGLGLAPDYWQAGSSVGYGVGYGYAPTSAGNQQAPYGHYQPAPAPSLPYTARPPPGSRPRYSGGQYPDLSLSQGGPSSAGQRHHSGRADANASAGPSTAGPSGSSWATPSLPTAPKKAPKKAGQRRKRATPISADICERCHRKRIECRRAGPGVDCDKCLRAGEKCSVLQVVVD